MNPQILSVSDTTKLEPFLLLAKSTRGAGCVQLISDALNSSNVFVFSELLKCPSIAELAGNPQHAPYLELLNLFAYGTYKEYKAKESLLPPLNDTQRQKLRQLSLVTLATTSRDLTYANLLSELELSHVRDLENLIIDAIYHNLISGRLDQKNGILSVDYAMGRDVKPGDTRVLTHILEDWLKRSQTAVHVLNERIDRVVAETVLQNIHKEEYEKKLEAAKERVKKAQQNKQSSAAGFMMREMDFEDRAPKRSAKGKLTMRH